MIYWFRETSIIANIFVAFELSLHLHPCGLCDLYNTCTGSHQKIPLTPHLINTITIYIKSHNNHKFFNHTLYNWCKDEFSIQFSSYSNFIIESSVEVVNIKVATRKQSTVVKLFVHFLLWSFLWKWTKTDTIITF